MTEKIDVAAAAHDDLERALSESPSQSVKTQNTVDGSEAEETAAPTTPSRSTISCSTCTSLSPSSPTTAAESSSPASQPFSPMPHLSHQPLNLNLETKQPSKKPRSDVLDEASPIDVPTTVKRRKERSVAEGEQARAHPAISRYASPKASKIQQSRLLQLYITRFIKHIRRRHFCKMAPLHEMITTHAAQNHFTDPGHFHSDYYVRYMEMVSHSANVESSVREEVEKFAWAASHWWGRCIRLSMQARRREMVKFVVGELGETEFENKEFQISVDEFLEAS